MYKKIVGILICMLLIGVSVVPSITGYKVRFFDNDIVKINNINQADKFSKSFSGVPPDVEWIKTFGGTGDDNYEHGLSGQQTNDGGYIVVGSTSSIGAGNDDVWLIKTYANGNMQWNKTYGGTDVDIGFSVEQTNDGGYIVVGYTRSYGSGDCDFWLIKTDANGNMQWNKTYGGINYDSGQSVGQTNDGGYIITGFTRSYGEGYNDVWLIKTNANGNMQWNKTYGGTDSDIASFGQQTNDGGYFIVGTVGVHIAETADVWLIKTDANGNMQWNKTYKGTDSDYGRFGQQTNDGGYIVIGHCLKI